MTLFVTVEKWSLTLTMKRIERNSGKFDKATDFSAKIENETAIKVGTYQFSNGIK